jgi:hypothetical protein
MRCVRSFPGVVIAVYSTIAAAQSPVSSNPTFSKYYSVNPDAGPTYDSSGTNDTPANYFYWNIDSSLVGDFLGRGTLQILLGGHLTDSSGAWQRFPVKLLAASCPTPQRPISRDT